MCVCVPCVIFQAKPADRRGAPPSYCAPDAIHYAIVEEESELRAVQCSAQCCRELRARAESCIGIAVAEPEEG